MAVDIEVLAGIVREAGKIMLQAKMAPEQIRSKEGHRNYVTHYDVQVQNFLEDAFRVRWPEYHFIAEEQDVHEFRDDQPCFIVDPIDGTSNFIFGIPQCCISVAAVEGGRVRTGVVYNPYLNEMYTAAHGQGSFLNGSPLRTPDLPLEQSLAGVGMSPYNAAYRERSLDYIGRVLDYCIDVRRLGSAALDLCYVASGRQGLYFEFQINPWDIAAGLLIAREAGAVVTTMDNQEPPLNRSLSILAANPGIHRHFLEITGIVEKKD